MLVLCPAREQTVVHERRAAAREFRIDAGGVAPLRRVEQALVLAAFPLSPHRQLGKRRERLRLAPLRQLAEGVIRVVRFHDRERDERHAGPAGDGAERRCGLEQ
ncbi:hypothetical protein D3C83_06310 [compost metagenome]